MSAASYKMTTTSAQLDRSQGGCCISVSLSYKTVNIVVSSLYIKRHACRLFSCGVIFTPTRVSLTLLSLRKNRGTTRSLTLVNSFCPPICRLHTKLYKGAWNVSANNSETVGHKDLRLGQIIYILVFYNISFSWLLPLNGFQFIFLCRVYCVTVKTKNKTFAFRQGELLAADCGLGSSSQRG